MKRLLFVAFALFAVSPARAWIFEEIPDKNKVVTYRLAVAAHVSTNAIIIDLSNTTNYPHKETGYLNISAIKVEIDKTAASTTTVRLGVINSINASTGSVNWVYQVESELNVSNTNVRVFENYAPNFLPLRFTPGSGSIDGSMTNLLSNISTSGSTLYQTDVTLPGLYTSVTPGTGDVVLWVHNGAAAVVVYVELFYHSNNR